MNPGYCWKVHVHGDGSGNKKGISYLISANAEKMIAILHSAVHLIISKYT